MWTYKHTDELCHFGVKGMKWGILRAQKNKNTQVIGSRRKITGSNPTAQILDTFGKYGYRTVITLSAMNLGKQAINAYIRYKTDDPLATAR